MKTVHLHIPNPCSENWNAMTVHDALHRHCAACDRVLTDFSQMTEAEIISVLQGGKKTCGRFLKEQLDRNYFVPEKISPRRSKHWWLILPSLFGSAAATAQTASTVSTQQVTSQRSGGMLTGRVTDSETNLPVASALVRLLDNSAYATTDLDGNFTITVPSGGSSIEVRIFGYAPQQLPVSSYLKSRVEIKMVPQRNTLSEVEIEGDRDVYVVGLLPVREIQPVIASNRASKIIGKMRLTMPFGKKHP